MGNAVATRRMRATVIHEAKMCEHWAAQAVEADGAGDVDGAFCLRFVAQQRSSAAFRAVCDWATDRSRLAPRSRAGL